jgi:hypothetical protein
VVSLRCIRPFWALLVALDCLPLGEETLQDAANYDTFALLLRTASAFYFKACQQTLDVYKQ